MPARLSINLDNLKENIENIRKYVDSNKNSDIDKIEMLVMVKADGYGAGIVEVSKYLEKQGVRYLGVAYLIEAKKILESSINKDENINIVMFSNILLEEIEEAVRLNVILSVSDIETAKNIDKEGLRQGKKVRVHINIDTGMTRLGVDSKNIDGFITDIKNLSNIEIEGVFTHLSSADTDERYTKSQVDIFKQVLDKMKEESIKPKYIHICNSAGVLLKVAEFCNMVRVGIAVYGYYPDKSLKNIFIKNNKFRLNGIFKLEASICNIKEVDEETYISYSKTYITKRKSKIATIQIGYADGLNRLLSNKYTVTVNGKEAKIVGNICMDMCMVDVTDIGRSKSIRYCSYI